MRSDTPQEAPPTVGSHTIQRPRLISFLENGLARGSRLIVLKAPIGYGKTTLVSQWLQTRRHPHSWLSFSSVQSADEQLKGLLEQTSLLSKGVPGSILVLDNFQELPDETAARLLPEVLSQTAYRLLILSRKRSLTSLRHAQQFTRLTALTAQHLALNFQEFEELAQNIRRESWPLAELSRHYARTSGWPALARFELEQSHLSHLNRKGGWARSPQTGYSEFAEQLGRRALEQCSFEERRALYGASLLQEFSKPLLEAIFSPERVEDILRAREFLEERPRAGEMWFRIHPLVKELLKKEALKELGVEECQRISLQACEWYASHQLLGAAYTLLLNLEKGSHRAQLLNKEDSELHIAFQFPLSSRLFHSTPSEDIERCPSLLARLASLQLGNGKLRESTRNFQRAYSLAQSQKSSSSLTLASSGLAFLHNWMGSSDSAQSWYETCLKEHRPEPTQAGTLSLLNLLNTHLTNGDCAGGQDLVTDFPWFTQVNSRDLPLVQCFFIAQLQDLRGHLREASQLYRKFLSHHRWDLENPYVRVARSYLASLYLEFGEPESAGEEWRSINLATSKLSDPFYFGVLYSKFAEYLSSQGREEEALNMLDFLSAEPIHNASIQLDSAAARISLSTGQLDRALGYIERHRIGEPEDYCYRKIPLYHAAMRVYLVSNNPERHRQALRWLPELVASSEFQDRQKDRVQFAYLLAIAQQRLEAEGEVRQLEHLRRAKCDGLEMGLGASFQELERTLADTGTPSQLLSSRELSVVRLMASGLSDSEIGETLFLSTNTVKWHNRRVYQKLGVRNRSQAVEACRKLKFI